MSMLNKYQKWTAECHRLIQDHAITRRLFYQRIALFLYMHQRREYKKKRDYKRKRFWTHPLYKLRCLHGFYEAIFPTLLSFSDKFENYFRLSRTQFEEVFNIVGPHITKQHFIRKPIPAEARFALTLRYLATGDCMISMSYQYLISPTTVTNIIKETCDAIWLYLREEVLPFPVQQERWLSIAQDFEDQWQFNHCIGAIDGKHVLIECPPKAGSSFINYKKTHSIVLLAICDANYKFIFVDIGAYGRRSDGGIFKNSRMGQRFFEGRMNIPEPVKLTVDGPELPYVLVGDEAFQLTNFLLRPYPGKTLTGERRIFNYRLSRARRIIENSFGILVSQWRILKKPIEALVTTTEKMVRAMICLHNWLRIHDEDHSNLDMVDRPSLNGMTPGSWRSVVDMNTSALRSANEFGGRHSTREATAIRDEFCEYFSQEGAVPWQYNRE